ncbi:MAG TPA: hypothetical protein VKG92_08220, partial [Flavobacteriales bacterium]|nr:hypothetical protein [Flavobacteriales bacterium]
MAILPSILMVACSRAPTHPSAPVLLRFEVGFSRSLRTSGSFLDPTGRDVVYFANTATHKKIRFYTKDGTLIKEVPLVEAVKRLGDIARVDAWDLDSIMLSGMYDNEIAYVNGKGECWRTIHLDTLLNPPEGDRYELWASSMSSPRCAGALFYHTSWIWNTADKENGDEPEGGTPAYYQYYFGHEAVRPLLARMAPGLAPERTTFLLDSFYYKLTPTVSVFDETAPYGICTSWPIKSGPRSRTPIAAGAALNGPQFCTFPATSLSMKLHYALLAALVTSTITTAQTWVQRADLGGDARWGAVGFSVGTKGYICLGTNGSSNLTDLWEWDQATDNWSEKASFPGPARREAAG